jgi:ATPase subunit of ABC transporter with duplicated ATPase domains
LPHHGRDNQACLKQDIKVGVVEEELEEGGAKSAGIPCERVNETLLGAPTVAVSHLKKTYGATTVVNELTFNMYENQIFALLGHNGAGKVRGVHCIFLLFHETYISLSVLYRLRPSAC